MFVAGSILEHVDKSIWSLVSGGSRSDKCGELLTGNSLFMSYPGPRMAVTVDVDLTTARYHLIRFRRHWRILNLRFENKRTERKTDLYYCLYSILQFFLKLGCTKQEATGKGISLHTEAVLVQFSSNGGVEWNTLQQFIFNTSTDQVHTINGSFLARMKVLIIEYQVIRTIEYLIFLNWLIFTARTRNLRER